MRKQSCRAQAAFEYLLLLGLITTIALIAMNKYLRRVNRDSEFVLNSAARGIMGTAVGNRLRQISTYP